MQVVKTDRWDRFGILVSALCLIHCVATPLILIFAPTLLFFDKFVEEQSTHRILFGFLLLAVIFALAPGLRLHGDRRPLYLAAIGIALMVFATFFAHAIWGHFSEPLFAIPASILIIFSHILNRRSCRLCQHDHHLH